MTPAANAAAGAVRNDLAARYYDLDEHDHPEGGSTMLGFWIYLMSDCLIFAMLFAAFGVLGGNLAAGPGPRDLFNLSLVALNTSMLLFSSITYGFAMLAMQRGNVRGTQGWLVVTGLFGAARVQVHIGAHGSKRCHRHTCCPLLDRHDFTTHPKRNMGPVPHPTLCRSRLCAVPAVPATPKLDSNCG